MQPGDLTATLFHLLGIPHQGHFVDAGNRPSPLTEGEPLWTMLAANERTMLGSKPATQKRTQPTGDVARVPESDPTCYLIQTDFSSDEPIKPITAPSRRKGWRADPLLASSRESPLGVTVRNDLANPTASIDFNCEAGTEPQVQPAAKASLAQEICSPRPGSFVFRARLRAEASSPEFFQEVFRKHFRCRLVLFQFTAPTKFVNDSREMASIDFVPQPVASGSEEWQTVELPKGFLAPPPGAPWSHISIMRPQ